MTKKDANGIEQLSEEEAFFPEVLPPEEPEEVLPEVVGTTEVCAYTTEQKVKAFDLFLNGGLTKHEIALEVSVPKAVVDNWSRNGEWAVRKKAIDAELFAQCESKYRMIVARNRPEVTERHLDVTKVIEDQIHDQVGRLDPENPNSNKVLARMAKALKDSAEVSARAAGVNDAPFNEFGPMMGGRGGPVINIGIQAIDPKIRRLDHDA